MFIQLLAFRIDFIKTVFGCFTIFLKVHITKSKGSIIVFCDRFVYFSGSIAQKTKFLEKSSIQTLKNSSNLWRMSQEIKVEQGQLRYQSIENIQKK